MQSARTASVSIRLKLLVCLANAGVKAPSNPCSDFVLNLHERLVFDHFQVVGSLEVEPEAGSRLEVPPQSNRCVRGDGPALMDDFVDPGRRHAKGQRQTVRSEAERLHGLFSQYLAWMNGGQLPLRAFALYHGVSSA